MIKYGLKIWSNNTNLFQKAVNLVNLGKFDFLEIYHNSSELKDYNKLEILNSVSVKAVHHGRYDKRWHDFFITEDQLPDWKGTVEMADFFKVDFIILHPGRVHNTKTFWENVEKINDARILIETMPGLDIDNNPMQFGQTLTDLLAIKKKKNICFDFEKVIKASIYQKKDYREFIKEAMRKLDPSYFHISGGDLKSPVDQHVNLWEAEFDIKWIRELLENFSEKRVIYLLFETPKISNNLQNDVKNLEYFKSL
ncbi:MAG: hypothetical protein AABY84_11520 [Candidatus Firestonebacteria bacterium]